MRTAVLLGCLASVGASTGASTPSWMGAFQTQAAPDQAPLARLAHQRSHGWTAMQAWLFYAECEALGGAQVIHPDAPSWVVAADRFRADRLRELRTVETPTQFLAYYAHWTQASATLQPAPGGDVEAVWTHVGVGSVTAAQRAVQARPEAWDEPSQAPEDWALVEATIKANAPKASVWPAQAIDPSAWHDVNQAVIEAGLRAVRLPYGQVQTNAQVHAWADQIRRANHELERRTGWSGPVLGLNGTVTWVLGDAGLAQGGATRQDAGGATVITPPDNPWGAAAHEWLHALRFGTARQPAWRALDAALANPQWTPDAAQAWRAQLDQGTAQRWPRLNDRLFLEDAQGAWRTGRLNRYATVAAIVEQGAQEGHPKEAILLGGEMQLIEAQLQAQNHASSPPVGWHQVMVAVQAASNDDMKRLGWDATAWQAYFIDPNEASSHAFEASFGDRPVLVSDVRAGHASLRYPLPAEVALQHPAWDALFQALPSPQRRIRR